jgi:hypothetical protein
MVTLAKSHSKDSSSELLLVQLLLSISIEEVEHFHNQIRLRKQLQFVLCIAADQISSLVLHHRP